MNVKELLALPQYGVRGNWPYNEKHVEVRERYKPDNYILTEDEAIERFGDRHVWLAFHDEGTFDDPIHGEHVYAICID